MKAPPSQLFQFNPTLKVCPRCRQRLLTSTPLSKQYTRGLLHNMGLTCYCVSCGGRYRAMSRLRYSWIAWAGPLGRWLWWQTTSLESTLPEADI